MLLELLFLIDFCTFCNILWLLPLLIIAWLLGWLYEWFKRQKYITRIEELESDYRRHQARITALEKELTTSKYQLEKRANEYQQAKNNASSLEMKFQACEEQRAMVESELMALKDDGTINSSASIGLYNEAEANDSSTETPIEANDAEKDKTVEEELDVKEEDNTIQEVVEDVPDVPASMSFGASFSSDNLQIIEGVGKKIEGLLKTAGYGTWSAVGDSSVEDLQKVLDDAGSRYRVHNPQTWPEQARLAADGDWDALINYQKFLDTGKDSEKGGTPSKIEKMYAKKMGLASMKPNDLKIVEGIGPKIDMLLQDAGINTWEALANCSVSQIQKILDAAGDRYRLANPKTWPKQARLAYESKWPELKTYQDFLNGGRE